MRVGAGVECKGRKDQGQWKTQGEVDVTKLISYD